MSSSTANLVRLLPEAGRLITKRLEERLRIFQLTLAQFEILEMIWESAGEPVSQKAIIECRGVEAATVGTTLARLERDGWIQRLPDPADRRGKLVVATEQAHQHRAAIEQALDSLETELAGFGEIAEKVAGILHQLRGDRGVGPSS